ncbi:MAG: pilus assembly protein PilO [Burkholderiaceae bacterium]|nr:MAG: pilus assembly protein PilO [Burkholderiaceae bacterium]
MSSKNFDLNEWVYSVRNQFEGLNPQEPGTWPLLPRAAVWLLVAAFVVVVCWFTALQSVSDELSQAEGQETENLLQQYKERKAKAINLESLTRDKEWVVQYVSELERQLPGRADMDKLLQEITRTGRVEKFTPGAFVQRDYYEERPIALRLTGQYHELGRYAADIAHLSRIVTLHNLQITLNPKEPGLLTLEATAKTYRYLDPEEVQARQAQNKGKPGGAK